MQNFTNYRSCHVENSANRVQSRWLTSVDSEMYREGMLHLYGHIKQHHLSLWLYDASKFSTPNMSDQKWSVEVLAPLLAGTSLRRIAVIMSQDVFLQTVAEQVRRNSMAVFKGSIKMKNFFDQDSAAEWLLAKNHSFTPIPEDAIHRQRQHA
ncbi:hypothetical protein DXT99_23300 [Pontibacter diazotrophicus]|uniref:STAS/SEC14 domain-containing protein n=1 Tax=Pontibacter diazotrophicus TaxID=1400979 RepID=A0A3D8L4U6_9BACT|nr:hypothetical protein [Pontibacter diazotrophicus]RDV11952.1 hypothetical protein DXT99_23300 [Pontibacter diazotrophicus]